MEPRRLVLVRHAQAADAPVDAERPLTGLGARRAAAIGSWLEQSGLLPDHVLVSPARRAAQTWEQASQQLPQAPTPTVEGRIYDNTVEAVLAAVRDVPDDVATLVVVGHNPAIGELTVALDDGSGDPRARQDVQAGFPTGGVAVFSLSAPLDAVAPGSARLESFAVPGA